MTIKKNSSNSDVDVLIPIYYSNKDYLVESIKSLLNQSLKPNIICILNGMDEFSNNFYMEILSELKVHRIVNSPKKGISNALNYGINFCNSKYIARQDDDDISHHDRIKKQKDYLESKNVDIIGSNVVLIDEFGREIGQRKYPETNKECCITLAYKTCFCHPSIMVKKEFFKKNKYPNISGEDYALWLKTYRNNIFNNYQENLYNYRIHPKQISKTNINYLYFQESKKVIQKLEKRSSKVKATLYLILVMVFCFFKRRKIDFKTRLS